MILLILDILRVSVMLSVLLICMTDEHRPRSMPGNSSPPLSQRTCSKQMVKKLMQNAMSMHSVANIKSFYDFVMQVRVKLRSFTDLYYLQEAQAYQARSDDKHQRLKTVLRMFKYHTLGRHN